MRRKAKATAIVAVAVASLALASSAAAKAYEVTKRGDPTPGPCKKKDCSLREAVLAANNHPGADKIVLPERKTYQLSIPNSLPANNEDDASEGDLDLTEDVRISHPGKGRAKIDAGDSGRHFHLLAAAAVTMKKLVLRGGAPSDQDEQGDGGAINMFDNGSVNTSSLTLIRSKVVGNHSPDFGGAIAQYSDGDLTVRGSRIVNNTAADDSGAIDISTGGGVTIKNSTIANNRSGSTGGASYSAADQGIEIVNTTISGNDAVEEGGALYVTGSDTELRITNSTIAGNHTDVQGGGIFTNAGAVSLNVVTVARNSAGEDGGGLFNNTADPFQVTNSLIALNQAGGVGEDCANGPSPNYEFESLGHNLLTSLDTDSCEGFDATGDFVNPNPKLGQLKSNGGPTQTIALKKGSPAINKANKQSAPKKDQRGVKRGKKPDIGAFERVKKHKKHRH